jgi:hypothetical protein
MGLIQEFQKADVQRRKEVVALARDVATMRAEADAFVAHLHRLTADRRSEVATMRADTDAFVDHLHRLSADRRSEVATMRADTDAFVDDLHRLTADRRSEVATMRADTDAFVDDLHRLSTDRRSEVATMRAEAEAFLGELHRLSAARHAEVWAGAAPLRRPAPPPPAAPTVTEGAPTTLSDVIFTYLAEHANGARLAQMEHDLGMPRIKLATEIRSLIEDKKVQKREMLYFAV